MVEESVDLILKVDLRGQVTYVSPSIRRYGYEPAQLLGRDGVSFIHADDRAAFASNTAALLSGATDAGANRVHRVLKADGEVAWIEGNPRVIRDDAGRPSGFINILRDVTAKRALEDEARAHAKLFEAAFKFAAIGKALVARDGRFLRLNDAFCRITGYSEAELLALDFQTITHPDDLDLDLANLGRLSRGEIDSYHMDKRYQRKDGTLVCVHLSVAMVQDAAGEPLCYVAQVEDLTDRMAAVNALKQSEARYRLIADTMSDVVLRMNLQMELEYISPSVRAYGYRPEEMLGRSGDALIHPDDLPRIRASRASLLAGEPTSTDDWRARYRAASGAWIWMEGNPEVTRDETGAVTGMINVLRDVTDRHEQAELFEAAFQRGGIGKALAGLDGRILKVNQALCEMLGYSQEAMLAMRSSELTHPDEVGVGADNLVRLAAGEIDGYTAERRFRAADGAFVWGELHLTLVRHADGSPKHYVVELADLTERHAAEAALQASEARYRLIADNTSDMIVVTKLTGEISYLSPSVRLTGWSKEALEGGKFGEQMHPDDAKVVSRAFGGLLAGKPAGAVRWRGRHGVSGDWIWMESRPVLLPGPDGAPEGFLDVVRDVTLQVAQEEALAAARAEAEVAAAAKAQFLANMSHEIRTPLTAVLGFTQLLKERPGLDDAAAGYVGRISAAGAGLLALVNDVLDFSKLEAGEISLERRALSPRDLVDGVVQILEAQASDKGLSIGATIDADVPDAVKADANRLRQILLNLAGNAVKFTESGGVRIAASWREGRLRLSVSDTGPGISPEGQSRLFQRFSQVDGSASQARGGTGLGLAICKGLVEAMDGTIAVESVEGAGSTFTFEIAAHRVGATCVEATAVDIAAPERGARVLVVDDNAVNRELVTALLDTFDLDLTTAASGEAALELCGGQVFDLILMDIRMPGMGGEAAMRALRTGDGPNAGTPILAFTADADQAAIERLLGAGFDDHVAKPLDGADLITKLAHWSQPDPWHAPEAERHA